MSAMCKQSHTEVISQRVWSQLVLAAFDTAETRRYKSVHILVPRVCEIGIRKFSNNKLMFYSYKTAGICTCCYQLLYKCSIIAELWKSRPERSSKIA